VNRNIALSAGALLGLGIVVSPALLLAILPQSETLSVRLPSQRRYIVQQSASPGRGAAIKPRVLPDALLPRISTNAVVAGRGPGIQLHSYSVEYGHRWLEEVTVPTIVGPFLSAQADVCGLSVRLGARMFDTSANAGGIKSAVLRELRKHEPFKVERRTPLGDFKFSFPLVREFDLSFRLGRASMNLEVRLTLQDGTFVSTKTPLTLEAVSGAPSLRRAGPSKIDSGGASFARLRREAEAFASNLGGDSDSAAALCGLTLGLSCAVGAVVADYVGEKVEDETPRVLNQVVTRTIDDAIVRVNDKLSGLRKPFYPRSGQAGDGLRLKLSADPMVTPDDIEFSLCMSVALGSRPLDPAIPGPPGLGDAPAARPAADRPGTHDIELSANRAVLNQLLYYLWQSRSLREIGSSEALLSALPDEVRDLAFDVRGFDPGLPPFIGEPAAAGQALPIVLADVALGVWDQRTVVGNALAEAEIVPDKERISVRARLRHVSVSCAERSSGGVQTLTPCLSDLLPPLRESLGTGSFSREIHGADLLARIPPLAYGGLRLDFSKLAVATNGSTPGVEIRANARIVDEPGGSL